MQVQKISNNSFNGIFLDKNLKLEDKNLLGEFETKLNKIGERCDIYIKRVVMPVKNRRDYVIYGNQLEWAIAPLNSATTKKKSFFSNLFKKVKQNVNTAEVIGYTSCGNQRDVIKMIKAASKNSFVVDMNKDVRPQYAIFKTEI